MVSRRSFRWCYPTFQAKLSLHPPPKIALAKPFRWNKTTGAIPAFQAKLSLPLNCFSLDFNKEGSYVKLAQLEITLWQTFHVKPEIKLFESSKLNSEKNIETAIPNSENYKIKVSKTKGISMVTFLFHFLFCSLSRLFYRNNFEVMRLGSPWKPWRL